MSPLPTLLDALPFFPWAKVPLLFTPLSLFILLRFVEFVPAAR